jgi:glycosyltransferase involved in cell wall biosynthesis
LEKKAKKVSMNRFLHKLAFALQARLPAKRRVYFIYTHKNSFDRFYNGLKSNTEISYWCMTALQAQFPSVRFLRIQQEKPERIDQIRSQDIVVGHIGPTFALAAQKTRKLIAFNPWAGHEDRSREAFNCIPHEQEMKLFDLSTTLVLLTSEYNKRKYFEKPTNFWYPYFQKFQQTKRVRLVHQPIDLQLFKRIKWDYQTSDFLYIGNNAHMKGTDQAIALVGALKRTLYIYGFGGEKIDHLNRTQVLKLPEQADFFIQPGMWEAQCVSILEAAARGFIPVVSEETGYPYSHPYQLRYQDFEYNLTVLKELLRTSPEERKTLADMLYEQFVTDIHHNNWHTLTDVLVEEVTRLCK